MNCELCQMVEQSQLGDKESTMKLVERFSPLLRKYARKVDAEDSFEELQCRFLELIADIDIHKLNCRTDSVIIKYINQTMFHQYIAISKKSKTPLCAYIDDLSDYNPFEYDLRLSEVDDYRSLLLIDMQNALTSVEYRTLFSLYILQYSVSETSKNLNISRQAVNQTKHRALKKLKNAWITTLEDQSHSKV